MIPRPRPRSCFSRCLAAATGWIVLAAGTAYPQGPPPGALPPKVDQQVQNDHPKFLVRASVDKKYRIYAEGEPLMLKVRCEEDAFLYILYQQADGKIYQIFPNSGQPDNRIKAMQDVQVPSLDDAFRWIVGPPFGKEIIKVIASKKPVDALSLPGLKEEHFNPVTQEQVAGAGRQLGKESPTVWSEHDVKVKTVRKGEPTEPPEARKRIGVFFGVADYEFNDLYMECQRIAMRRSGGQVSEDEVKPLSLGKTAHDAEVMARVLKERGDVLETRLFVNAQATKDQIREMITEWLPSATRPGDTVFFFFSGHGSQIPDDDGDEKDGLDEVLNPYDDMGLCILDQLVGRQKQGLLAPALSERVVRLWEGAKATYEKAMAEASNLDEKEANIKANREAGAYVNRMTSVTDDEMGHWMQKLDGRRVVVILDACRSGGMTPTGGGGEAQPRGPLKGDLGFDALTGEFARAREPRKEEADFDFLTGEFARLKDLDQPSLTVFAAAGESESSIEMKSMENGLFTTAILEKIRRSPPVELKSVSGSIRDEVVAFVESLNKRKTEMNKTLPPEKQLKPTKPFVPQLFTTDPQPVYLVPPPESADVGNHP